MLREEMSLPHHLVLQGMIPLQQEMMKKTLKTQRHQQKLNPSMKIGIQVGGSLEKCLHVRNGT